MADRWNPHSPHVVGLEFAAAQPHRRPREFTVTAGDALMVVADQETDESVSCLQVAIEPRRKGNEPQAALAIDVYRHTADAYRWEEAEWERLSPSDVDTDGGSGPVYSPIGTPSPSFPASLDPSAVDDALYLSDMALTISFDPQEANQAGRRIRDARIRTRMARAPGTTGDGTVTLSLTGALLSSPVVLREIVLSARDDKPDTYLFPLGEQYPAIEDDYATVGRGLWTPTSISHFDGTAPDVGFRIEAEGDLMLQVESVVLEILHTTEDRYTSLVLQGTPPTKHGASWYQAFPDAGWDEEWEKDRELTYVMRGLRRCGGGVTSAVVPTLAGDGPFVMGTSPVSRVVHDGRVREIDVAKPQDRLRYDVPRAFGFIPASVADNVAVDDSYGYADLRRVRLRSTLASVRQQLGVVATGAYWLASLPVAAEERPTENLRLDVRRRSDDSLVKRWTFTPEDWDDGEAIGSGAHWRRVILEVDTPANLVAATEYDLEVSTPVDTPEVPWGVQILRGPVGNAVGLAAFEIEPTTYGGDLTVSVDGVPDPFVGDLSAWVSLVPDNVGSFSAMPDLQEIAGRGLQEWDLEGIPRVKVSWERPEVEAYDPLFRHYEIQRRDEDGAWETVARLTDIDTERWFDYEARVGVMQEYRLRVARAITARTGFVTDSCVLPSPGTGYTLTSNQNPDLNLGYVDLAAAREGRIFDHLNARKVEWREMIGRDYAVKFSPSEDRGVAFSRRFLVAALGSATRHDTVLDALLELADRTSLPYVCVRDEHGGRWYCGLVVERSQVVGRRQVTSVEVQIREVAGSPEVDDT